MVKKADGLYQLVKHLKNSNVPIDAVGFQCHLNANIKIILMICIKILKGFKILELMYI